MSLKKYCDPFNIKDHDLNWLSSVNIAQISSDFLEEYTEFVPVKLSAGAFLCDNCRKRIENHAHKFQQCCNPLGKRPHRTKLFRKLRMKRL